MSELLKIPKRDRGKYEYIKCGKCKMIINEHCRATGKKIKTCPAIHRHKFHLRYYVPNSGSKYLTKNFTTRDYKEFKKQAQNYIDNIEGTTVEEISEVGVDNSSGQDIETSTKDTNKKTESTPIAENVEVIYDLSFKSILLRYADYLNGIENGEDIPGHMHKTKDPKTIDGYLQAIRLFKTALYNNGIKTSKILITEIGDKEVGYFHNFLIESKKEDGKPRYGNRSYNNKMNYNKAFIKYVKEHLGINMVNPFDKVNKKYVETQNLTLKINEFFELLKIVTKRRGVYESKEYDKIVLRNHYRTFLKDAYILALHTGERRDGVVLMKWNFVNIEERYISLPNYKVNKIMDREKKRLIPITVELYQHLLKMGYKKKKGSDEYIICPEHENRATVKEWISKSFTHYWLSLKFNPDISFTHLRKTYVTIMYSHFGNKTEAVTDQNVDTILKHYLNKMDIVSQAKNMSLFELDNNRNAA